MSVVQRLEAELAALRTRHERLREAAEAFSAAVFHRDNNVSSWCHSKERNAAITTVENKMRDLRIALEE